MSDRPGCLLWVLGVPAAIFLLGVLLFLGLAYYGWADKHQSLVDRVLLGAMLGYIAWLTSDTRERVRILQDQVEELRKRLAPRLD